MTEKYVKLKYLCEVKSGDFPQNELISEEASYPLIGGGKIISRYPLSNALAQSITVGRVGTIGDVRILENESFITDNGFIITANKNIYPRWLYYSLKTINWTHLSSGTAQPLITSTAIKNIKIKYCKPSEQKKIADELDRELAEIDEFIADQQRLLELATEKFNAELRQLTYPADTPTVPLKRFAQITLGKMITPSDKGGMELAPYIRAANIQPGGVFTYQSDHKKMWFSSDELSFLDLKKGDVLVVEGGAGFGRSAVLEEDLPGWGFQNSINRIRVIKGLADPNFISFYLQAQLIFGDLNNLTNQSTIPHLTAEKLAQVKIPNISHQNQIAASQTLINKLDEIIEIKQYIKTSIDFLIELKNAKINKEWK